MAIARTRASPLPTVPLALIGLATVLAHRMHQEAVFPAVDFPAMSDDPFQLPLADHMQLAIIEHGGVAKAYPLDYVIHHHVVNDRFGDRIVALTYCAMCRSIIPFDVTDIGPLFVGSFKNANMIVADRRSKTYFQQATFESVIGRLHPRMLTMIPFQILPWSAVRRLEHVPRVCQVTQADFREFKLPIPGVWRRIMASEATPGLSSRLRDKSFPARTHVIGVINRIANPHVVYLKSELMKNGVVKNGALNFFLVALGDAVNAFKGDVRQACPVDGTGRGGTRGCPQRDGVGCSRQVPEGVDQVRSGKDRDFRRVLVFLEVLPSGQPLDSNQARRCVLIRLTFRFGPPCAAEPMI